MAFTLGSNLLNTLANARIGACAHLEDFADRLNHFFSAGLILTLAGIAMTKVYFLRSIACTLPTAPGDKFNEFAESVCWVMGTVALRDTDKMPMTLSDWEAVRQQADISFYQWVPFCLSIQALLFFVPHTIWQALAYHTMGENLEAVLSKARNAEAAESKDKRVKYVEAAAYQLFRLARQHHDTRTTAWADYQRRLARHRLGSILAIGKRMGNWMMAAYLLVKILYLSNCIGQMFLIRTFLGYQGDLLQFGDKLIGTLISKREWDGSEFFPRQTYCPVQVRHLGARGQLYTAICALPVNMFNEKIYIFLWIWIAFVTLVTGASLVVWIIRALWYTRCHTGFSRDFLFISIASQLNEPGRVHQSDCKACNVYHDDFRLNKFIKKFMRTDGAFLIRMVRINAGDVVAGEILNQWWHFFVEWEENCSITTSETKQTYGKLVLDRLDALGV